MNELPDKNQLVDFELLTSSAEVNYEIDFLLYYVINGSLNLTISGETTAISDRDFFFVNSLQNHIAQTDKSSLVMRFTISRTLLANYCDIDKLQFQRCPLGEMPAQNKELMNLLEECIAFYYGKKKGDSRSLLKLNSLYFEIADLLVSSFLQTVAIDRDSETYDKALVQSIAKYVQMNFRSPLTLEDLAKHFFLSTAYISRFFKKNMGVNFSKYLAKLRLEEAVREMERTEKSLTRIIIDCGFPNQASFNKAFRERYSERPKDYRAALDKPLEAPEAANSAANHAEFNLLNYLERNENFLDTGFEEIAEVQADTTRYTPLHKPWNRLINIGGISLFLQKQVQEHTKYLCDTLGFEYVRVWDLYEKVMHINVDSKEKKYNFSRLDTCLDFFKENHIKPYIELGFKPFVIVEDYDNFTVNESREIPFQRAKDFGEFVGRLVKHLINRYSVRDVSDWIFEVWCDPRWFPQGDATIYINYFEQAYQAIKELSPLTKVGGDYDRTYGVIDFALLVQQWSKRAIQPNFVSIYAYLPIIQEGEREKSAVPLPSAPNKMEQYDLRKYILGKKRILQQYGMTMPLYCSEYSFTIINLNVINDSRFKGADLMHFLMRLHGDAEMIGYWFGTDLFVDDDHRPLLLNGRCGLITHQKICKPAYWALSMLNSLREHLLAETENAMVTRDDFDNYVITCHNYKGLDIQYYTQDERDVTIENVPHLYVDNRHLTLRFTIKGVQNGVYYVKTRVLNSQYGGVQDEWMRMGKAPHLTTDDVRYIDHMSCPHMTIVKINVADNTLRLDTELEPLEMQSIHAFRYIDEGD